MFLFDIYGIFLYSIYAGEGIGGKKPGALTQEKNQGPVQVLRSSCVEQHWCWPDEESRIRQYSSLITAIPLMPTLNTSTVLKELTAGAFTREA